MFLDVQIYSFRGQRAKMTSFSKLLAAAALSVISVSSITVPAFAEGLTPDLYRARVVDYCLYDQWARAKEGETKSILNDCKCAAKAYVEGLNEEELGKAVDKGDLNRSQKREVLKQYAVCKK